VASSGASPSAPPAPQELEISIFGPGFGECVVLHLGNGEWGVIDSCLDPDSKRSAALHYLESIRIDVATAVKFVVATHWHDDHMQGISAVFQEAKSAFFVCTQAVRQPDFNEVLSSWTGTRFLVGGSGVDELRRVLAEIKKRNAIGRTPAPILASAGKELWRRATAPRVAVKALSPSDAAVLAAVARLNGIIPGPGKARRRVPSIKPNDASVVLSVQAVSHRLLLGADLEVRGDRSLGWTAVVEGMGVDGERHQVFKVPHHGSPTGHSEEVWDKMLIPQPWSATTPFVHGKVRLPTVEDCRRILNRTPRAYLTAPPLPGKYQDLNRTVEKTVTEVTRSIQFLPGRYGHVRIRKDIAEPTDSDWRVELFGDATTVKSFTKISA